MVILLKLTREYEDLVPGKLIIWYMKNFYLTFTKMKALRSELTWTHYRLLLKVEREEARNFYMLEAVDNGWGIKIGGFGARQECQTACRLLLKVEREEARNFYMLEAVDNGWGIKIGGFGARQECHLHARQECHLFRTKKVCDFLQPIFFAFSKKVPGILLLNVIKYRNN